MSRAAAAGWDLPAPHIIAIAVVAANIDAYEHVNNAVYVTWFDRAAWAHSASVGLPLDQCLELDRGMAVLRSVVAYLRPALLGDMLDVATWLLPSGRVRIRRRFQVRRDSDGATLARAEIDYACLDLSSGKPTRWPPEFRERYIPIKEAVSAYAALAPTLRQI